MIHKKPNICLVSLSFLVISLCGIVSKSHAENFASGIPVFREIKNLPTALAYASDPIADIAWSAGYTGVDDVQAAFNNARQIENNQLGTSLPVLTLPSQPEWDGMNDNQKALWLINRERIARNALPLHGLEENVYSVAQYYAEYLLDSDAWGHYEDGNDPWTRLDTNPAIATCHDFLNVAENLTVFVTTGNSIPLPIERSVYNWMYIDGDCCSWGHRHAILWTPYNNNSGLDSNEGFMGIGRSSGGPYQGPFTKSWPYAEIIVMNVFDPCSSWEYPSEDPLCSPACVNGTCTAPNTCSCDAGWTGPTCQTPICSTDCENDAFPWILFLPAILN